MILKMSKKIENKLIIFIWEWKSEKAFFENFLISNYWFKKTDEKWDFVLERWNIKVWLAFPKLWDSHKWWDSKIISENTYKDIKWQLLWLSKWIFKDINIFKYFILTDEKLSEEKESKTKENIEKILLSYSWDIYIAFASYEIETWFIWWIWEKIKKDKNINIEISNEFIGNNKDIDKVKNTKEILYSILPEELKWKSKQETIARYFWDNIDKDLAIQNSKSFEKFIEELENIIYNW